MDYRFYSYNRPIKCSKCGGEMIFKGVGEYQCDSCKNVEYDDYGKVRLYIEEHSGATAAEIEAAIGVKQRTIRELLRQSKIEIASESRSFMKCEYCGADIRSGRMCEKCEKNVDRRMIEQEKLMRRKAFQGFGLQEGGEEGEKRFHRQK